MSEQNVRKLFNTLSQVESKVKSTAYPIHKRLDFGAAEDLKDVYDWLFKNLNIPENGKTLDAGCGVGYGSFYLAERTNCSTLGISLSEYEIALAKAISKDKKLENRVKFECQSFDEPLTENYDFIIAVESVKHTMNLPRTIQNLLNSLNKKGRLVIVEDFFNCPKEDFYARLMTQDWSLKKKYSKEDFINQIPDNHFNIKTYDLTPFMLKKNNFWLKFRFIVLHFLSWFFSFFGKEDFWKIMRGGLGLDILYARNEVTYEVLEIEKINEI